MKWIVAVFCLLIGSYFPVAEAVSLKINPGINLLVLDGHKLPGSLLKGADSIELERGQHQILFTLESSSQATAWILTFDADSHTVSIVLPDKKRQSANRMPCFQLVDENQQRIPVIQDRLVTVPQQDYLAAINRYNLLKRKASVAKFSHPSSETTITADNACMTTTDTYILPPSFHPPAFAAQASLQALLSWFRDFRTS